MASVDGHNSVTSFRARGCEICHGEKFDDCFIVAVVVRDRRCIGGAAGAGA
jgi:hypothetical protein